MLLKSSFSSRVCRRKRDKKKTMRDRCKAVESPVRQVRPMDGPLVEGGEAVRRKRKEVPLKERTKEGRREA